MSDIDTFCLLSFLVGSLCITLFFVWLYYHGGKITPPTKDTFVHEEYEEAMERFERIKEQHTQYSRNRAELLSRLQEEKENYQL